MAFKSQPSQLITLWINKNSKKQKGWTYLQGLSNYIKYLKKSSTKNWLKKHLPSYLAEFNNELDKQMVNDLIEWLEWQGIPQGWSFNKFLNYWNNNEQLTFEYYVFPTSKARMVAKYPGYDKQNKAARS